MLVLTRRIGETLVIGDDVQITFLGMKGSEIKVGIKAPREIPVHRLEVHERIQLEKEAQAKGSGDEPVLTKE